MTSLSATRYAPARGGRSRPAAHRMRRPPKPAAELDSPKTQTATLRTVRQESLWSGVAARRRRERTETHRLRQLLGRGRHRRAATVSVPPGVPAGAGPALATAAHRKDRARPTAGQLIAARYPDRTVHVVGDAAYVGERLRDLDAGSPGPAGVKLTSVLHELPPPRTGRSGRPRTRGARLGTPADVAALATTTNT